MNHLRNESTVRSQVQRMGYVLRKSRRQESHDNLGGYKIVDPYQNLIVAGEKFELSLDDVVEWLES